MLKLVVLALAFGLVAAVPLVPGMPGTITHTTTAHHGLGYGAYGGGYGMQTHAISTGYPGMGGPYGFSGYPGITGMGYGAYGGFPAAKQITQVSTTAIKPGFYGYY